MIECLTQGLLSSDWNIYHSTTDYFFWATLYIIVYVWLKTITSIVSRSFINKSLFWPKLLAFNRCQKRQVTTEWFDTQPYKAAHEGHGRSEEDVKFRVNRLTGFKRIATFLLCSLAVKVPIPRILRVFRGYTHNNSQLSSIVEIFKRNMLVQSDVFWRIDR